MYDVYGIAAVEASVVLSVTEPYRFLIETESLGHRTRSCLSKVKLHVACRRPRLQQVRKAKHSLWRRVRRFGPRLGLLLEASPEGEIQIHPLDKPLALNAQQGGARGIEREALLLHGAQVA